MNQDQLVYWKWKIVLIFLLIFAPNLSIGQATTENIELIAPKVPYAKTLNPEDLAEALTAGKISDREKFDAIFSWVVNNIHYNTRLSNSGKAFSSNRSASKVLRNRKGICSDYASLMDILCDYAGITNTTITGYAKEMNFDVGDPIYFDNHAWNAVKLDGNWHLYDATWSSGLFSYEYTRCSKRRMKWIEKLYEKEKEVTVHLKLNKKGKYSYCGLPNNFVIHSVTIRKVPFLVRALIALLNVRRFRVKEKYRAVVNLDYYLTSPEIFAIDHFPSDRLWTLAANVTTVTEFSDDKAYYFRTGAEYENMSRIGQTCIACDDLIMLDSIEKIKRHISSNLVSNKNNHFLPGVANLELAQLFYQTMLQKEDSLQKISYIDSTLQYLEESKKEFIKSKPNNSKVFSFQNKKNRTKLNLLLQENKAYSFSAKKVWKEVDKRKIKFNSLVYKTKSYSKRDYNQSKQLSRALNYRFHLKIVNEKRIEKLQNKFFKTELKAEELTQEIAVLQDSLIVHFTNLWGNLYEEYNLLYPLLGKFRQDKNLRSAQLLDNYDRQILEIRDSIRFYHESFVNNVDEKIIQLADKSYAEFKKMNLLIKNRNVLYLKSAKTLSELYNGGATAKNNLDDFETEKLQIIKNDICWNADNEFLINNLVNNFKSFNVDSRLFFRSINHDNQAEKKRYEIFKKHDLQNKERIVNAIKGNSYINQKLRNRVLKYRSNYLKKLKEERKKKPD
ncbi:MAG: transglutaminase domain-containing protein [Crocinitomicaceae bacterium]